jgi:hypothetical protein
MAVFRSHHRADDRVPVRLPGEQGQMLADLDAGDIGRDRPKFARISDGASIFRSNMS